jgi:hypothetical protein
MGPKGEATLFDLPSGERAKEAGQLAAGSSDRAWEWRQRALDAIYDLASAGMPFTADDVIAVTGLPDLGPNRNNAVGATFSAAAKRGWIVHTGAYRKSRRVLSHARAVAVWAGNPDWEFS